ncbi:MAG TPA: FAD-dependent oxidoreductase [Mariprofundaceae bacterium]|nr:FAD-dependent oxidoreductase [Mariprofundaceae bacterium]
MAAEPVDVDLLVIGGGIHGVGIACEAAGRGMRVLLAERRQLAAGTSSQSTKLIHGGLRYLEQARLQLVYEGLIEREALLSEFPELVRREWFHIPVFRGGRRPAWMIRLGLMLYWLLSGGNSRVRSIPREQWSEQLPGFATEAMTALLAYEDAATDDAALVHAVAAKALAAGADIREHAAVVAAERSGEGWRVSFDSGELVTTNVLVNAAGPWIAEVAAMLQPAMPQLAVQLVQGIHLLLPHPCPGFIYVEAPDGRAVFLRPWPGGTLVGITETPHAGSPDLAAPTEAEIDYLLAIHNRHFPTRACGRGDILRTYCGLRVLPQGEAFAASRETLIVADNEHRPTYLAVYGGKLTTFRRTARRLLDRIHPA